MINVDDFFVFGLKLIKEIRLKYVWRKEMNRMGEI
jgi:hypothetical protein